MAVQTEMSMVLPAVFLVRTTEKAAIWSSTLQQVTVGEMKNVHYRVGMKSYKVKVSCHLWEKTKDIQYCLNVKGEEIEAWPLGVYRQFC